MEDGMTGINIIELVQTGFHGAAIAVLFFSAYLLRDYSQRVLAIEKGKQDIRIVDGVRKLIIIFMVMSGLFFIFGVAAQIYSSAASRAAEAEVVPAVTDLQDYEHLQPTIFKGGAHHEPGQAIVIRDGEDLIISVRQLTDELDANEKQLIILRTTMAGFAQEEAGI
jgi:hypothetical protein